jgi:excisionase family DNA binding protein
MDSGRLLTITDAAKALAVSKGHVYRLAAVGALRIVKVGPQTSRVPAEDVERIAREGIPSAAIRLLQRRRP